MRRKIFISVFVMLHVLLRGQEFKSKADKYFYSYAYKDAIEAYQNDLSDGKKISNYQYLNLADSYFNTGNYNKAVSIYLDIHKKDTIIDNHRFNKMLQSLAKTSDMNRVKAFLNTKSALLSNELLENAEFNFELQEKNTEPQKFNIFNVSGNSPQADISPSFYKESKLLFSSSRPQDSKQVYGPSGESYLDIYVARIGRDNNILNPNVFTGMPDSEFHKSTPFATNGYRKIFYILSNTEEGELIYDEKGKNALAIGMVYDNGFFTFLLRDLSTSFYYPFFDEKTDRLYFAANFEDGYGGTDLYYVSTNNGQIMSQPINLGPRINSPGNEIAPYVLDNKLFFSSDIFYGNGGMDVYKSNIRKDQTFSMPINLGKGINTRADEFGFIIRRNESDEYVGYLASNRKGGKGGDDIYGFSMSESIGPNTIAINGKVVEPKYQQGIFGVEIKLIDENGKLIKSVFTQKDGSYLVEITSRDKLNIEITKDGHSSFYKSFSGHALKELQENAFVLEMFGIDNIVKQRENKTVLDIKDFFFAKGKSVITPEIELELDKVIDIIRKFPQLKFAIETHTDSRGGNKSNLIISQKRADAIKNYLFKKGLTSANIAGAKGFGEERIVNNCTNGVYCLDFLHKQNLRTLFVVQNYDQLK